MRLDIVERPQLRVNLLRKSIEVAAEIAMIQIAAISNRWGVEFEIDSNLRIQAHVHTIETDVRWMLNHVHCFLAIERSLKRMGAANPLFSKVFLKGNTLELVPSNLSHPL